MINALEYPNVHTSDARLKDLIEAWSSGGFLPPGHYSYAEASRDAVTLARDPLGCNKLFYGRGPNGDWVVANRIDRCLSLGVPFEGIASCPPGHVVRLGKDRPKPERRTTISQIEPDPLFSLAAFRERVAAKLDFVFSLLVQKYVREKVVVCLSGGLDSTVIAAYARRHFGDHVVAATFACVSDEDGTMASLAGDGSKARDFKSAHDVAATLAMEFLPVIRGPDDVLRVLRPAMRLCQDWRDFNVHCAIVNYLLGEAIAEMLGRRGERVLVLTGDLMNEFVSDYGVIEVDGVIYYPQPRAGLAQRRRFLVRGLDAGDREIGVFSAFGLTTCRPFSALAEDYMRVPAETLEQPNAKFMMNAHLIPATTIPLVNLEKTRAQVGGDDLGVLGVCHRAKLDQDTLRGIWAEEIRKMSPKSDPFDIIDLGVYRKTPADPNGEGTA